MSALSDLETSLAALRSGRVQFESVRRSLLDDSVIGEIDSKANSSFKREMKYSDPALDKIRLDIFDLKSSLRGSKSDTASITTSREEDAREARDTGKPVKLRRALVKTSNGLNGLVDELRDSMTETKRLLTEERQTVKVTKEALAIKGESIAQLQDQLDRQRETHVDEKRELMNRITVLERNLQDSLRDQRNLTHDNDELTTKVSKSIANADKLKSKLRAANNLIAALETSNKSSSAAPVLPASSSPIEELRLMLLKTAAERDSLWSQLQAAATTPYHLPASIASHQRTPLSAMGGSSTPRVGSKGVKVHDSEDIESTLRGQLETLTRNLEETTTELDLKSKKYSETASQLAVAISQKNKLEREMDEVSDQLTSTKVQLIEKSSQYESDMAKLRSQLESQSTKDSATIDNLTSIIEKSQGALDIQSKSLDELTNLVESLNAALLAKDNELKEIKSELLSKEGELAKKLDMLHRAKRRVESLVTERSSMREECESEQSINRGLLREVEALHSRNEALLKQLDMTAQEVTKQQQGREKCKQVAKQWMQQAVLMKNHVQTLTIASRVEKERCEGKLKAREAETQIMWKNLLEMMNQT